VTEIDEQLLDAVDGRRIVIELAPYRQRRRTRRFAAGLLVGYLAGAFLLPAAAELVEVLLDVTTDPPADRLDQRIAAYSENGGDT
jgi:hypothetical protein